MSIFDEASKHAAYISLKLGKLKKNTPEYDATQSTKDAILALGKELAVSTGTNSPIVSEKQYKSRPIPSCSATHTSDVVVTRGALHYIAFNTNEWDDLGWKNDKSALFHSTTVENTRFYVHQEGKYYIAAYARLAAIAVGSLPAHGVISLIRTANDGTSYVIVQQSDFEVTVDGQSYGMFLSCFANPYLFPGDYVRATIFHDNTGGVNRTLKANESLGGLEYLSPRFYISGPTGETNKGDATRHFRPSSIAMPSSGSGGSGSATAPTDTCCKLLRTSNQAIGTGSWTGINFTSESYDNGGFHDNSTNNTRLTIPVAGTYKITGFAEWATGTAIAGHIAIWKNGTTILVRDYSADISVNPYLQVNTDYHFSAGDYVELKAFQASGGNIDIVYQGSHDYTPTFSIVLLRED